MHIFLIDRSDTGERWLNHEESRHCMRVLRHQIGDTIYGVDGLGRMYVARIESYHQKTVQLTSQEVHPEWGEHAGQIRIAISPLRLKDRFEWLIEKAVELGVNAIIPIQCQRTDKFKSKFKVARIETILRTALKQCMRSRIPELHPLTPFHDFMDTSHSGLLFIARGDAPRTLQSYDQEIRQAGVITLMIGPEGDFTDEEYQMVQEKGGIPVGLGKNRLRSETAGVYGLGVLKMVRGY